MEQSDIQFQFRLMLRKNAEDLGGDKVELGGLLGVCGG
jgi:hypothetical protein